MNRRHADFQSAALPTELSGQPWWRGDTECVRRCPEGKRISFQEGEIIVLKQCFDWLILPPALRPTLAVAAARPQSAQRAWKSDRYGSCNLARAGLHRKADLKQTGRSETRLRQGREAGFRYQTQQRTVRAKMGQAFAHEACWRCASQSGPFRGATEPATFHTRDWQLRHFPPESKAPGTVASLPVIRLS